MCFVTKKLVRLTRYAKEELKMRYHKIFESSLASEIVIPTTSSSIMSDIGRRNNSHWSLVHEKVHRIKLFTENQRNHFSISLAGNVKMLGILWLVLI